MDSSIPHPLAGVTRSSQFATSCAAGWAGLVGLLPRECDHQDLWGFLLGLLRFLQMAHPVSRLGLRNVAASFGEQMGEDAMDGAHLSIQHVTPHMIPLSVWAPALTLPGVPVQRPSILPFQKKTPPVLLEWGKRWGGVGAGIGPQFSCFWLQLHQHLSSLSTFRGTWCHRFLNHLAFLGINRIFFFTAPQLRIELSWFW